jgi:ankyrin repeat protein
MSQESKSLSRQAIIENSFRALKELLRRDPNLSPQGFSVYHVAAIKGDCQEMMNLITRYNPSREMFNIPAAHPLLPCRPLEFAMFANNMVMTSFLKTFDIETLKATPHSQSTSIPEEIDKYGQTFLIKAITYGKTNAAKALIMPSIINHKDNYGYSALHHAVVNNDVEIVKALLEANCEVGNIIPKTERDELRYSLSAGNLEIFKLLYEKHGNNSKLSVTPEDDELAAKLNNKWCFSLLGIAASRGNHKFLNYLVTKYSKEEIYEVLLSILEISKKINSIHSHIFIALYKDRSDEFAKYLPLILSRKDLRDDQKLRTLVDFQPQKDKSVKPEQKVKSKKKVVEVSDSDGEETQAKKTAAEKPAQVAAVSFPLPTVQVKPYSLSFEEVMAAAVKRGDNAAVTLLKRRQSNEKFMSAVATNNLDFVEYHLKINGFIQNEFGSRYERPIHVALENGCLEMATLLLAHMDYSDASLGESILIKAAERGYDEIVALLLPSKGDAKAVAGAKDQNINFNVAGGKALLTALQNLASKVLPLKEGSAEDYSTYFLRIEEIESRYSRVLLQLIDAGANINIKDPRNNCTPLMYAAQLGLTEVVSALLKNNADLECFDLDGRNALMHAVFANNCETTQAILKHKPSLHERDGFGRNIWNHADEHTETPVGDNVSVEKFHNLSMRNVLISHLKEGSNKRKAEDNENGADFVVDKRINCGIRMWASKENESSVNRAALIAQEEWSYLASSFNQ